ncbi:MAG TPA: GNAT family N-acetyltransferase [Candidatus Eisenbacteria bacterium]|nr:GNAT family N-acetyltransferase [Candidatus Eisenbacteria bacterium]
MIEEARYEISRGVPTGRFDELMALYRSAWWSDRRTADDVRRLVAGPSLFFFAAERPSGKLVAMARALSDGVYKAMVFDVIVLPEHQGAGLGRRVMEELLAHPELRHVQHVELYCLPELERFYERWGFTGEIGGVRLIRRTQGKAHE